MVPSLHYVTSPSCSAAVGVGLGDPAGRSAILNQSQPGRHHSQLWTEPAGQTGRYRDAQRAHAFSQSEGRIS